MLMPYEGTDTRVAWTKLRFPQRIDEPDTNRMASLWVQFADQILCVVADGEAHG